MDSIRGNRVFSNFCEDINASSLLPLQENSVWNFSSSGEANKEIRKKHDVTGTSVVGIKFKDGVMVCADNLGSYGSTACFFDCPRVLKVNESIILGAGGRCSDFQYITSLAEQKALSEEILDEGFCLKPKALSSWLRGIFYQRRSSFNPLWNTVVIGGMEDEKPFLAQIDKLGTLFESPSIATGIGAYLVQPILRHSLMKNPKPPEHEAKYLLYQCMDILCSRDALSFPKYTVGVATTEGTRIEGPFRVQADWNIAHLIEGYE